MFAMRGMHYILMERFKPSKFADGSLLSISPIVELWFDSLMRDALLRNMILYLSWKTWMSIEHQREDANIYFLFENGSKL